MGDEDSFLDSRWEEMYEYDDSHEQEDCFDDDCFDEDDEYDCFSEDDEELDDDDNFYDEAA
jgi:hypothetical protein